MAQRSTNGGCIALVAVLLAVIMGAVLLLALHFMRARPPGNTVEIHSPPMFHDDGTAMTTGGHSGEVMVFADADRPTLTVPAPGEPVTLRIFAAFTVDDTATDLAKDSFRKAADKTHVSWRMRLQQLSDQTGELRGDFEVPWEIRHGGGSSRSSFRIRATFDEAGRAALLTLRRGDWVTVEGQLNLRDGEVRIENAMVADAPVAEKP